jgi:hypothetical protein
MIALRIRFAEWQGRPHGAQQDQAVWCVQQHADIRWSPNEAAYMTGAVTGAGDTTCQDKDVATK